MTESPSSVGSRAEIEVAAACARAGMHIYIPLLSGHGRVDLVIGSPVGLQRVQCKSATLRRNSVVFRTHSNTANTPRSYVDEVDAFGVYSPQLDAVFLVPVDDAPLMTCSLRLSAPRNGQRKGIRWAVEYLVGPMPASLGCET